MSVRQGLIFDSGSGRLSPLSSRITNLLQVTGELWIVPNPDGRLSERQNDFHVP